MTTMLASLPMHLVCQLIIPPIPRPNNTNIDTVPTPLPPKIETPILPDGYIAYPDIGVAYKLHNETTTWKEARKSCIRENAQLALIDSAKKFQYLRAQRAQEYTGTFRYTHVGIHSLFDDNEWVSVSDGKPVTSIPWAADEPSGNYDCVMVDWTKDGLSNGGCGFDGSIYACEIPILQ